jgi:hypothetical protein
MDDHRTSTTQPGIVANGVGYDPSEVNALGVTVFTMVMIGVLLAVFFGVTLYFEKFSSELIHERVDDSPAADLAEIRARETKDLNSYEMLDKSKGVVRIPLDQAMKALLAEVPAGKGYSTKDQTIKVEPAAGAPATPGAPGAPAAPALPAKK